MDIEKESNEQLWHRLQNEPRRAFEAFQTFLSLPSGSRTVVEAYRRHVNNAHATRVSDTWTRWSRDFAWSERAAAFDDHLESLRREAYERVVVEESERQAREVERMRGRYNELMTLGYERAMGWLEGAESSDFRPHDVIQIIRLHMDALKAFEATETPTEKVTWTEEEEAEITQIIREIEAEGTGEEPDEDSDEGEEDSEESEDRPQ
jgi:hypothetical protein